MSLKKTKYFTLKRALFTDTKISRVFSL